MSASNNVLFRFGVFELDTREATLRKSGVRVHLQQQPLQALQLLLEAPGHLVSRDKLRHRVWGDETVVDFERGLNYCIKQIREALADDPRSPRFVETVRGRGYRFLAAVEHVELQIADGIEKPVSKPRSASVGDGGPGVGQHAAAAGPLAGASRSSPWLTSRRSRIWIALAATAPLVLAVFLVRSRPVAKPTAPTASTRTKLVVLPFVVLENGGQDIAPYLVDGVVDELISALGGLKPERLGVIARTSTMRYRHGAPSVREIAEQLDVDFVLEGSLRRDGESIRLTAQLVEVAEQTQVWSQSYVYPLEEFLALEREATQSVVRQVAGMLLDVHEEPAQSAARSPGHDAYLRARYEANKNTDAGLRASLKLFKQAQSDDPEFAVAYVGEANAHCRLALAIAEAPKEAFAKAQQICARALAIDAHLPEAHAIRALTLLYNDLDWSASRDAFEKSLALNPGLAQTHHWYAMHHAGRGDHVAAIAAVERARQLDPLSPHVNADVGWYYYFAGRYEEAIEEGRRTLALEPLFFSAAQCIVLSMLAGGAGDAAVEFIETMLRSVGADETVVQALRQSYDASGIAGYWQWVAEQTQTRAAQGAPVNPFALAMAYANLGRNDDAMVWLQKAYDQRALWLPFVHVDPMLQPLHADARFKRLVQRMGLVEETPF